MEDTCKNCGAPAEGRVCAFCGSALIVLDSKEEEKNALNEYTEALVKADKDTQIKMLRGGFLPTDPEVLIDAGMRLITMIEAESISPEPGVSAENRLLTIKTKLELVEQTTQVVAARKRFDELLRGKKNEVIVVGIGCAVLLLAALGIVLFFVFR